MQKKRDFTERWGPFFVTFHVLMRHISEGGKMKIKQKERKRS